MLIRRIARPMLAAVFVAGGVDALRNPAPRVKAAAPLVAKGEQVLPNDITDKVPTDPDTLVKVNAGVQIGGGLLLATGKLPRLASLALAGSLVPTTLAGHAFWEESDAGAKAAQRTQFLKNVSLLGGLLIAAVDTQGKPSVAWRTRKGAERAQQAVTAALPFVAAGSTHPTDSLRDAAQTAAERGQEVAHRVAESDTTKRLAARGSELAHTAAVRGSALASDLADEGSKRGRNFAAKARKNADSWGSTAAERAEELARLARERADEGGKRGRKLSKRARKEADRLSAEAAVRAQVLATQAYTRGQVLAAQGKTKGQDLASSLR